MIDVPWGEGLPADRYEEVLAADKGHRIKAVLATHNETATGVRSHYSDRFRQWGYDLPASIYEPVQD